MSLETFFRLSKCSAFSCPDNIYVNSCGFVALFSSEDRYGPSNIEESLHADVRLTAVTTTIFFLSFHIFLIFSSALLRKFASSLLRNSSFILFLWLSFLRSPPWESLPYPRPGPYPPTTWSFLLTRMRRRTLAASSTFFDIISLLSSLFYFI